MKKYFTILLLYSTLLAQWPVDTEPYGFMGCKQLRFRGVWEHCIDSNRLDESIDGVCVTVAIGNIMLYYRWPPRSQFDGAFIDDYGYAVDKRIDYTWNYPLITGTRTVWDCDSDNPEKRYSVTKKNWNGLKEIRTLIYAVERSYGYNHEYFRVPDDSACQGDGYYAIEHALRNRFGYPGCYTIKADTEESRKVVIQNLKAGMPVIGMRCDHIYILDGYKYDPVKKRDLFHSTDYLQWDASMGWFPWKYYYREKLDRFVVNITPQYRLNKGPSCGIINYEWGEGYLPATEYTVRLGKMVIWREHKKPLGSFSVTIKSFSQNEGGEYDTAHIYHSNKEASTDKVIIPEKGYFTFSVNTYTRLKAALQNKDPWSKNLRIMFIDKMPGNNLSTHTQLPDCNDQTDEEKKMAKAKSEQGKQN